MQRLHGHSLIISVNFHKEGQSVSITTFIDHLKTVFPLKQVPNKITDYANVMRALSSDVVVTELSKGHCIVDELFIQTFGHCAPTHGQHVVVFCRIQDGSYRVANYLNYWVKDDACYIGGAITDKNILKKNISKALLEKITAQGGLSKLSIMYAVESQLKQVSAVFGYTEVPRSLQVILDIGFVATAEPALYVKWAPEVSQQRKDELLAQAIAIGAF